MTSEIHRGWWHLEGRSARLVREDLSEDLVSGGDLTICSPRLFQAKEAVSAKAQGGKLGKRPNMAGARAGEGEPKPEELGELGRATG